MSTRVDACFRSQSVQDIISRQPDLLTRFAFLFFIFIGACFLISTCFIRYNEKIDLQSFVVDSNDSLPLESGMPDLGGVIATNRQFYALAVVNKTVAEKVKKGQEVTLDFPLYSVAVPDTIRGYIGSVFAIPGRKEFAVVVDLPRVLLTSHNRQLRYWSGLSANMHINTSKKSLFNHFFNRM